MTTLKLIYVGIFASAFLTIGCGGLKPLTTEQKALVKATMDSTSRSVSAPKDLTAKNGREAETRTEFGDFEPMMQFAQNFTAPSETLRVQPTVRARSGRIRNDQNYDRMQRRWHSASNCKLDLTTSQNSMGFPAFRLTSAGSGCPVTMDLALALKKDADRAVEVQVACKYQVVDPEYRTYNDIDGMDAQGNIQVSEVATGSDVSGKVVVDVNGKLHSQKHGDVGIKLFGNIELSMDMRRGLSLASPPPTAGGIASKGEMGIRLDYPSFSAELKAKGEGDKGKFFINNEEVSQKEFESFFDSVSSGSF